jgi:hypothetical protein
MNSTDNRPRSMLECTRPGGGLDARKFAAYQQRQGDETLGRLRAAADRVDEAAEVPPPRKRSRSSIDSRVHHYREPTAAHPPHLAGLAGALERQDASALRRPFQGHRRRQHPRGGFSCPLFIPVDECPNLDL